MTVWRRVRLPSLTPVLAPLNKSTNLALLFDSAVPAMDRQIA